MRAAVVIHLPERFVYKSAARPRQLLYDHVRELVASRGGRVVLAPSTVTRDDLGNPLADGNLHIVNNGRERSEGYLNAATAYLEGYWHLDPMGVQGASSISAQIFDPAHIDMALAEAHLTALRNRFVETRHSRYRQPQARRALDPGGIAIFLQGRSTYRHNFAHLRAKDMVRAVAAGADGREVWVKPHPLYSEEGVALIGDLKAEGLPLRLVTANVHDILAAAAVSVSANSAAAIEGLMHGTPAILFGRSDFHAAVETVYIAAEFPEALARALGKPRDYAAFLHWYFSQCLDLNDPMLPKRLLETFAAAGFPPERLGMTAP